MTIGVIMQPARLPSKIGRYRIARELGRGGMGVVFLAVDPFIDRKVAIKTSLLPPPSEPGEFEEFQKKFFNEARAAGKLMHRNIVSVYDASVDVDHSYLVMEYVDGVTLYDYCRPQNLLPLNKVINVVFQCAKALDFAHEKGVIHRDVKPRNILMTKTGRPKISDFGIASIMSDSLAKGQFNPDGTMCYSAPELLRKESVSPQTDIFSLGVVMYELLSGKRPFHADSEVTTVYKILNENPRKLREIRKDVPESLERIIEKCLAKDLDQRFKSGLQLAQAMIATFDHLRYLTDEINQDEKLKVLKKINFFKDFTSSELAEVIRATQWVKYEGGSIIIKEGEVEDFFYIIVSGEALVRKRGRTLAKLTAGEYFGEMAYLGQTRRTATVLANNNVILIKLSARVIDRTSISTQLRFHKVFSKTLISRLAHTSDMYSKTAF